ncbi:hypothetical protein RRG08_024723 [Elysia crispata]|uniref:Claudin n=1 Tax=Elysia crispata TaxID=231223 RepID=A0AAE0YE06_9GAST|nr:hypothetical protein RRG08_024723 [Elysia crispata]
MQEFRLAIVLTIFINCHARVSSSDRFNHLDQRAMQEFRLAIVLTIFINVSCGGSRLEYKNKSLSGRNKICWRVTMDKAFTLNLVATSLLIIALVLHIVCLATPHYSEGHFITVGDGSNHITTYYFGMWKICAYGDDKVSTCVHWTSDETSGFYMKEEDWMRGVQAMALLGMIFLVLTAIAAVLNVIVKSKGDRLRLLYIALTAGCVVGASFIFIGDIIMAAKHRHVLDEIPGFSERYGRMFYLSWGFGLDIVSAVLALGAAAAHFIGGACFTQAATGLV